MSSTDSLKNIIIYDAKCLMCQGFLSFLDDLYHKKNKTLFVSSCPLKILEILEEKKQSNLINKNIYKLQEYSQKTIIYIKGLTIKTEFSAIINLLLDSNHKIISPLAKFIDIFIPKFIGNLFYKIIAKYRQNLSKLFFKNKCKLFFNNLMIIN